MEYSLTCTICGSVFRSIRPTQKTCSPECKAIHDRNRKRACQSRYNKKFKSMKKRTEQELNVVRRQSTVIDLAVQARNAGLSYGKYVASIQAGARYGNNSK